MVEEQLDLCIRQPLDLALLALLALQLRHTSVAMEVMALMAGDLATLALALAQVALLGGEVEQLRQQRDAANQTVSDAKVARAGSLCLT
jgi:hypothetical protein